MFCVQAVGNSVQGALVKMHKSVCFHYSIFWYAILRAIFMEKWQRNKTTVNVHGINIQSCQVLVLHYNNVLDTNDGYLDSICF